MKNPIVMIFLTLLGGAVVFYFILSSAKGLITPTGTVDQPTPEASEDLTGSPTPTPTREAGAGGFGDLER